jgi:two-component system, response regulator
MNTQEFEILLVEDNPDDAELALNALKKHNLANKVHWVEDGEEAIDFLYATGKYKGRHAGNKPKLILLDLKLPKVDGMEVLKKIKTDEKMKTIPVVILTSSREESDIINGYQLGVNSYIVKPVDFEQFSKSVLELGLYWLILNQPSV